MIGDPSVSELQIGEEVTFPEGTGVWVGDTFIMNPGPGTQVWVWGGNDFVEASDWDVICACDNPYAGRH